MAPERSFRVELRRRFPTIELGWFCEVIELVGIENTDELIATLADEEQTARAEEARRQEKLVRHLESVIGETLHRDLQITVSPGIDLEHVQAILIYGFAMPTRRQTFAGARYLPKRHIRANTERKLGLRFSVDAYHEALNFLERNHVIERYGKDTTDTLYSFNLSERAKGVSAIGRGIIAAVKQYLFERKR